MSDLMSFLVKRTYTAVFLAAAGAACCFMLDTPLPALIIVCAAWALGSVMDRKFNPANKTPQFTEEQKRAFNAGRFVLAGYISVNTRLKPAQRDKLVRAFDGLIGSEEDKAFFEEQFQAGRASDFDPTDTCVRIRAAVNDDEVCRRRLLDFLVYIVFLDGVMTIEEKNRLVRVAERLSVPLFKLERYIRQNKAMSEFSNFVGVLSTRQQREESKMYAGGYAHGYVPHDEVANALEIFGLSKKAGLSEVHSAYLKMMRKYHPDRLAARGLSPDMLKVYSDKTKVVQQAYEILKKHFEAD